MTPTTTGERRSSPIEDRNRLVEENLGLAHWAAQKFGGWACTDPNDLDDLVQVATRELIRAAELWDGTTSKFTTYATHCMMHRVRFEAQRMRNLVHVPNHHRQKDLRRLYKRFRCRSVHEGRRRGGMVATIPGPDGLAGVDESLDGLGEVWERFRRVLTPRQYQILHLVYAREEPLGFREAAETLGVSHQLVSATLRAARRNLVAFGVVPESCNGGQP